MPLLSVVVTLLVIGVLLGLLNLGIQQVPQFPPVILRIINAVVVLAVVLWLVSLFLPLSGAGSLRVGR